MHVHRFQSARLLADRLAGRPIELSVERGELVPFSDIQLPGTVPPNSRVEVLVSVANEADVILPLVEQDICTTGGFNGFLINVEMEADGVLRGNETKCIGAGGEKDYEFSFVAPDQEGEVEVTITSFGANTGNELNTQTRTVTVREDAPSPPDPDENGDTDGQFRPFLCFLNPLRACNFREQVAMAGSAGFFLILLLLAAF